MTSVNDLNQPVVLDLGSGLTKAGYAGTPDPSVVIGTLVGHPKLPRILPTATSTPDLPLQSRTEYASASHQPAALVVGEDLHTLSGIVRLQHPMKRGAVDDWHAAEEVWRHVTSDLLSVAHGEHPFLVTEGPLNPRRNREKMAEVFFESLNVPSFCVSIPAILALYASGRTTGLVLDVGDTVTVALPVAEGHCDLHAIRRIDMGGRDITDRLTTLLRKSGSDLFTSSSERQAVRRLKERLGYVAVTPREEEKLFAVGSNSDEALASFELPDGNVVQVGPERFRAPEILFRPDIVAKEYGGIHECVGSAISSVDVELRRRLYSSILLAVCLPLLTPFLVACQETFGVRLTSIFYVSSICRAVRRNSKDLDIDCSMKCEQ